MFGPTREETTGQYRIKTNQELKELYARGNIINEVNETTVGRPRKKNTG